MSRGACTFRQRDVAAAIKAARDAGVEVARVEIDRKDGKIIVIAGKPNGSEAGNQQGGKQRVGRSEEAEVHRRPSSIATARCDTICAGPGFERVPLPGLPWSTEFMDQYQALMAGDDTDARCAGCEPHQARQPACRTREVLRQRRVRERPCVSKPEVAPLVVGKVRARDRRGQHGPAWRAAADNADPRGAGENPRQDRPASAP